MFGLQFSVTLDKSDITETYLRRRKQTDHMKNQHKERMSNDKLGPTKTKRTGNYNKNFHGGSSQGQQEFPSLPTELQVRTLSRVTNTI